jgi:uncharacterized membrane protein
VDTKSQRQRVTLAGILLGLGLGGFFDGIVLHQILQWHHMLTSTGNHSANTVAGLQINTLWDGLFHATTYLIVLAGLVVLWRVLGDQDRPIPWSTTGFIGTMLMGWGIFNLSEGIVDHHILGIHHVRAGENQLAWDLGFLAWGAAMLVGGWFVRRAGWQRTHAAISQET